MKRILYLHNSDDWAIHNVGKLWFAGIDPPEVVMKNYHKIDKNEVYSYDYVWYGYSLMFLKLPYDLNKTILSVHDPLELFPQVSNWKEESPILERVDLLRRAYKVITASVELKDILSSLKVDSTLIPTSSLLPTRSINQIETSDVGVISVFEDYPRKNFELMKLIEKECSLANAIKFTLKRGREVLPENEYIDLLDSHCIYLCTSFQEGGPIPAFDAMKRGLVVLTTKVGQIQELIIDGYNGFICDNKSEFVDKIKYLSNNTDKLQRMRINAVRHIQENRDAKVISKRVNAFISENLN